MRQYTQQLDNNLGLSLSKLLNLPLQPPSRPYSQYMQRSRTRRLTAACTWGGGGTFNICVCVWGGTFNICGLDHSDSEPFYDISLPSIGLHTLIAITPYYALYRRVKYDRLDKAFLIMKLEGPSPLPQSPAGGIEREAEGSRGGLEKMGAEEHAPQPSTITRRVDLIVSPPEQYPFALVSWTGSKVPSIAVARSPPHRSLPFL